jgi:hypothetical protein
MCSGLSRPADAADSTRAVCAVFLKRHEGEDTCMSYEEEDTCMSYEEEDMRCIPPHLHQTHVRKPEAA